MTTVSNPLDIRVLFADDDQMVQELFVRAYQASSCGSVATYQGCTSAKALLEIARTYRGRVALYVIDYQLPGQRSLPRLVQKLHRLSPSAVVLVRSGLHLVHHRASGMGELHKGKSSDALAQHLISWLAKTTQPQAAPTQTEAPAPLPIASTA
ncbi:MAG: hypothetical protein U0514_01000 [Candidatus Andersenbacteria bacterium]